MATELKPCPFCGGEAMIIVLPHARKRFVKCKNQCCEQNTNFNTREEAIEAWNRRANDESCDD